MIASEQGTHAPGADPSPSTENAYIYIPTSKYFAIKRRGFFVIHTVRKGEIYLPDKKEDEQKVKAPVKKPRVRKGEDPNKPKRKGNWPQYNVLDKPENIEKAKAMMAAGDSQYKIAAEFGITQQAVSLWKLRLTDEEKEELKRLSDVYNQQFAAKGMEFVAKATDALFTQLDKKMQSDEPIKDIREVSQAIKHVYEASALASGRTTNNTMVMNTIDPELSELLKISLRRGMAKDVTDVPYTIDGDRK